MIKECVYCNKKFEATIKRQKYCSHLCNVKSYYKRHKHEIMKTREKYQKKEREKLELEKKLKLVKRNNDIKLLKQKTGINNHAEVAYYYDTNQVNKLLKVAKYRQENGLVKIRSNNERMIVRPHSQRITMVT